MKNGCGISESNPFTHETTAYGRKTLTARRGKILNGKSLRKILKVILAIGQSVVSLAV